MIVTSVAKNGEVFVSKSKGKIKFFNSQKGFGFITPANGEKELFVHISNIQGDVNSLREGDDVEYVERAGRKGPEAAEVTIIS
jgi:CspA family cold shock protein